MVPGAISAPNPYADLSKVYPNLGGANQQISQNVINELRGELSPETLNAIQNSAAAFGVTSGMPGSGLAVNRGARDLGLSVEQLQGKGLQDYLAAITGISGTQTVRPELQTEIATQNAIWNAAPDPSAGTAEQLKLMGQQYELQNPSSPSYTFSRPAGAGGGSSPVTYDPFEKLWRTPAAFRI